MQDFSYFCYLPTRITYWGGWNTSTTLFASLLTILRFWPPFNTIFDPFWSLCGSRTKNLLKKCMICLIFITYILVLHIGEVGALQHHYLHHYWWQRQILLLFLAFFGHFWGFFEIFNLSHPTPVSIRANLLSGRLEIAKSW